MRLPEWIKVKGFHGVHETKRILRNHEVTTVCEEARCPNIGNCYSKPTVTFMLLGSKCTRNCGFCSVESARPGPPDPQEPERVARASKEMGLKYVIITSVTRDDLPDGGAGHFASTVKAVRNILSGVKIEVLTPDFTGDLGALMTVLGSKPDVFGHNVETVPRLYPVARPQADYLRSLHILKYAKEIVPDMHTKSGLMLGLGETPEEVTDVLNDLRKAGCDSVTMGQYLRPSKKNLPVVEYIRPEIFETLRKRALHMGFKYVASSPLVRSSLNVDKMYATADMGSHDKQ
ncbi:MAG: lipoyl synthase [Nitrospirae bacterium RBG_13_43_8]|nr:MAG: lipoyl synthase [Nitrospirae bacterium RBG_13_43_8]